MTPQDAPAQNSDSTVVLPPIFSFEAVLSKLVRGSFPVLPNAVCQFSVHWNFSTNEGYATLLKINNTPVNITLHPLGIAGQLDFMSDMKPTSYFIEGKEIIVYRVILDTKAVGSSISLSSAAIMFNKDGSCIEATDTINEQTLASLN